MLKRAVRTVKTITWKQSRQWTPTAGSVTVTSRRRRLTAQSNQEECKWNLETTRQGNSFLWNKMVVSFDFYLIILHHYVSMCTHSCSCVCANTCVHVCVSNVYRGQRVGNSESSSFSLNLNIWDRVSYLMNLAGLAGQQASPRDPSASTQACTTKPRCSWGCLES